MSVDGPALTFAQWFKRCFDVFDEGYFRVSEELLPPKGQARGLLAVQIRLLLEVRKTSGNLQEQYSPVVKSLIALHKITGSDLGPKQWDEALRYVCTLIRNMALVESIKV